MPRARVYSGLQISLGPIRFLVNSIQDENVKVIVVIFNEASFSGLCPVETFEKLMDWHGKLPIGQIESDSHAC